MSLPKGWINVKFTDVLDVQGGTQPPKSQFIDEPKDGYVRLLQIRDFGKKPVPTYIPDTSKLKKVICNDVLIGRYGASVGRICTGMEGAYNVALAKVLKTDDISSEYLRYYLLSSLFQIPLSLISRSAQNGFNKQDLSEIDFLLPPLNEQKRIAKKLDELLATVESIKTRLDNAPTIIKRFRQSILASATSGKLTEEWRGANGVVDEWENLEIGTLFSELQQGWSPKCENTPVNENEWGVIKTSSVQSINFIESENKRLPLSLTPREKLSLKKGDILITRAGPRVRCAITCYVHKNIDNLMICDKVYRIRVDKKKAEAKYIVYILNSPKYLDELENMKTGISDSGLNLTQKKFKLMEIDIPCLDEQKEIVSQVESLFAQADTLEEKIEAATKRVDKLTQSILAKAFRGELVEQDPNDESAEDLLERIKGEG